MSLKNPVTRPGIDPGTVRLVNYELHISDKNVNYISTCNVDSDNNFEFRVSKIDIIYGEISFCVGCDGEGCPIFAISNSRKYHVVIQTE
jgi:hypothetical protein